MTLGERVYVAPFASIRGDEGQPIYIGDESNVQDGVVLHGFETIEGGKEIAKSQVEVAGKKYSLYVGKRVSMAHQSRSTGRPRSATTRSSLCRRWSFKAEVEDHVVVEPGAKIFGVKIASGLVRADGDGRHQAGRRGRAP